LQLANLPPQNAACKRLRPNGPWHIGSNQGHGFENGLATSVTDQTTSRMSPDRQSTNDMSMSEVTFSAADEQEEVC